MTNATDAIAKADEALAKLRAAVDEMKSDVGAFIKSEVEKLDARLIKIVADQDEAAKPLHRRRKV